MNTYGILLNGSHIDVSKTERGAKNYASRNGYDTVTIRYNCGYIAEEIAYKNKLGKWISLENGQIRYN
jgi:hypothetical protein